MVGLEWYRDPFQNVGDRWTATAGLGYEIVDTPRTSWSVTAGPAWQSTQWDSAPPNGEDSADSFALRLGTRFDHDFTKSIDFHAYYNAFFTDEASGTYTHHFDTGVEIELTGDFDVNVAWVWDRVEDPPPLEDGSFPKRDDTRLVFGLGWSFERASGRHGRSWVFRGTWGEGVRRGCYSLAPVADSPLRGSSHEKRSHTRSRLVRDGGRGRGVGGPLGLRAQGRPSADRRDGEGRARSP